MKIFKDNMVDTPSLLSSSLNQEHNLENLE